MEKCRHRTQSKTFLKIVPHDDVVQLVEELEADGWEVSLDRLPEPSSDVVSSDPVWSYEVMGTKTICNCEPPVKKARKKTT